MKRIKDYKEKSPLQEWAWNRFRFKGAVTASIALLNGYKNNPHVTDLEKVHLNNSTTILNMIVDSWERSQTASRKGASK